VAELQASRLWQRHATIVVAVPWPPVSASCVVIVISRPLVCAAPLNLNHYRVCIHRRGHRSLLAVHSSGSLATGHKEAVLAHVGTFEGCECSCAHLAGFELAACGSAGRLITAWAGSLSDLSGCGNALTGG
jgi:hypothetical protein